MPHLGLTQREMSGEVHRQLLGCRGMSRQYRDSADIPLDFAAERSERCGHEKNAALLSRRPGRCHSVGAFGGGSGTKAARLRRPPMKSTVRLTDLQLVLLATAAQRDDGSLWPVLACPGCSAQCKHPQMKMSKLQRAVASRNLECKQAPAMLRFLDADRTGPFTLA